MISVHLRLLPVSSVTPEKPSMHCILILLFLQEKLKEIHGELEPMQNEFQKIEGQARFRSSVLAYAGLILLCGQFCLFVRLTYWELSWDVMEPVSYFTGQLMVRAISTLWSAAVRDICALTVH